MPDRRRRGGPARLRLPPRRHWRTPSPRPAPARDPAPTDRHGSESRSRRNRAAPIRAANGRSFLSLLAGAAAVADGAEFVALVPVRPGIGHREIAAEPVEDLQLADRARPVPGRIIFVARLVIAVG